MFWNICAFFYLLSVKVKFPQILDHITLQFSFIEEVLPDVGTKGAATAQGNNPSNKKGKKDKKARKQREATVQNNQKLKSKFNSSINC